jgi:Holliday junction resolvase
MTASKKTGTAAEREVVNYLKKWWPAAERRALSGNKDKGDVAGIPGVVVEVKAASRLELAKWQRETYAELANAGVSACVLVVKRAYKAVSQWDAYVPADQIPSVLRWGGEQAVTKDGCIWVRMDLLLAATLLKANGY